MSDIKTFEGDFRATKASFGILAARFYGFIVESLVAGNRLLK